MAELTTEQPKFVIKLLMLYGSIINTTHCCQDITLGWVKKVQLSNHRA